MYIEAIFPDQVIAMANQTAIAFQESSTERFAPGECEVSLISENSVRLRSFREQPLYNYHKTEHGIISAGF